MIYDIDDCSLPDRVEKQVKVLQNEPNLSFVSGSMAAFKENLNDIFKILRNKKTYPTNGILFGIFHFFTLFLCLEIVYTFCKWISCFRRNQKRTRL